MIPNLDTVSLGQPVTRLGVSFFPAYLRTGGLPEIATGSANGDASALVVEELDRESVPVLRVFNSGKVPFLLIEGEHFFGGLQNRALNVTVLVPPGVKMEVPVTCTEAGRWRPEHGRESRRMAASRQLAPANLRRNIARSVVSSRVEDGAPRADQGAAWAEVDAMAARVSAARPPTAAAADIEAEVYRTHRSRRQSVEELARMGPLPGQNGLVVTHGRTVKAVELFGSPGLLAAHWGALIRSCLVEPPGALEQPSATNALWAVRRFGRMHCKEAPGVGLGSELHARDSVLSGHALVWDGRVVHAAMQFSR